MRNNYPLTFKYAELNIEKLSLNPPCFCTYFFFLSVETRQRTNLYTMGHYMCHACMHLPLWRRMHNPVAMRRIAQRVQCAAIHLFFCLVSLFTPRGSPTRDFKILYLLQVQTHTVILELLGLESLRWLSDKPHKGPVLYSYVRPTANAVLWRIANWF